MIFPSYSAGYMLFDVDTKGMPQPVRDRVAALGGAWGAIVDAVPKLAGSSRVIRKSSSSGISNPETGETRDSDGQHIYMLVRSAVSIPEILKRIHDMLWLAGLGWYVVGAAGQMLERSLIDTAVGSPERLVFEGPVILGEPLVQESRLAIAFDGRIADIKNAVLPWGGKDDEAVKAAKQTARYSLRGECEIARAKWSASRIQNLVEKGHSESDARAEVSRWLDDRQLTGEFELHFVDAEIGTKTVAEVIADPDDFIGENLYDLFEDHNDPDTRRDRTSFGAARTANCASARSTKAASNGCWRPGPNTSLRTLSPTFRWAARSSISARSCSGEVRRASTVRSSRSTRDSSTRAGKPILKEASQVIMERYGVNHMTWAPGEPQIITGKFYDQSGWIVDPSAKTYNTFHPIPDTSGGDVSLATPWVEHVKYVYPNKIDHNHILDVLAYVVQNVGGKVNHALVLAGEEGIGKDTILKVLSYILGGPNVVGVGPDVILDAQFNPYAKSLVLVIAEARDLGNGRYKLNNKLKDIITTTSTGLYVNEKGIPEYSIPNHMFVCITTNFPDNGLYVNEGSRRYFVATSKVPPKDPSIPTDYFARLHAWLEADGFGT